MEEVRKLRLEKGWNQNELAFHAGLAPSVISLLETGKREPNATTLRKLAEALDVEIPDLFGRSKSPKKAPAPSPELEQGRRSLTFIKALRGYFWNLRLRWLEPNNKPTPGQIRDALELLQSLVKNGAFEGPWTPKERFEIQVLFQAANKLKPIAEEFVDDNLEHLEQVFEEVNSLQEQLSA